MPLAALTEQTLRVKALLGGANLTLTLALALTLTPSPNQGGSGVGKTALIERLAALGYATVPEAALQVIGALHSL